MREADQGAQASAAETRPSRVSASRRAAGPRSAILERRLKKRAASWTPLRSRRGWLIR